MVPVGLVGQGGTDLDDRHALALVGDVGVRRHGLAVAGQLLEGDHCLAAERGGVEGELDVDRPLGGLGRERLGGRDGVAVGVPELARVGAVLALHVQGAGDRVLLARREVRVADRVRDRDGLLSLTHLLAAGLLAGVGTGLREVDVLTLVGDVGVGGISLAAARQLLEGDHGLAAERGGVEGELHLDGALARLRGERLGGRDGVAGGVGDRAGVLAVLAALMQLRG